MLEINPKPDIDYEELSKTANITEVKELTEADLSKKFKIKDTEYEIRIKKKS